MQTGNIDNVQPGYDDKNKEMPEQKPNSDMQSKLDSSHPDCINANVVGSPLLSPEYTDFVPTVNKLYESCRKTENGRTTLDGELFVSELQKMGMNFF